MEIVQIWQKLETKRNTFLSYFFFVFPSQVHIKPQPPRSQSLNRLEEYKSIPYSVGVASSSLNSQDAAKDVDIEAIESYCNEARHQCSFTHAFNQRSLGRK